MVEASSADLEQSLRASVQQDEEIVELLFLDQISFRLRDENSLTYFKQLLDVRELFVYDALTDFVKNDSQESTDGDDDCDVEAYYTHLEGVAEEGTDDFFVVDEHD